MSEDRISAMLRNLDDDLIEKEIDHLMDGAECDMESVKKKAYRKLEKYNKKTRFRKRLPYAAAICACFICINAVYADEISRAVKSFFNKTPVYSTMVDGSAYYLNAPLALDDSLVIDSFIVAGDRLEMRCTSKLGADVLEDMKIVPQDAGGTQYVMGGYGKDGDNRYMFSFINGKEKNYNIKPFKSFDLVVGGKTYLVHLDPAQSLDSTQKLAAGETAADIDLVTVGANSIEKNGKLGVQLIASFQDQNMKLRAFGRPVNATVQNTVENLEQGLVSHGTPSQTETIYGTDQSGVRYKLEVPADAKARPVTTFETDAPQDSRLTINLPALLATYEKSIAGLAISIPEDGEKIINSDIDMVAQKATVKSIKRLSPKSAELVFQLNTGDEEYVRISSFHVYSKDIKKISSEFSGDKAVMILEFDRDIDETELDISWPTFVINGNWTINMK